MINYILQVILFQVLFLTIYDFFLSKETFFTKNRWYLLITPVLSFLIPFIKIPGLQKAVPQEFIVYLPEIFLSPEKVIEKAIESTTFYESINYVNILFWIGLAVSSVLFLIKLVKIINLILKNEAVKTSDFILILLPKQTKAFSFFNYIFLGQEIAANQKEKVIQHELVHSRQKHSLDLLLFELLKIAMWFNPMIYFYQKRITLIHEYISDAIVVKSETKEIYINNLLSNFFQVENIAFVNQFYKQSLIKKRIIMMTKKQSKKMNQLKYLVLIPVLASMLFYSSCSENVSENIVTKKELVTSYRMIGEELTSSKGGKETYLDFYMGTKIPKWKEISYNDLTNEEKSEHTDLLEKIGERDANTFQKKFYRGENGRNIVAYIIKFSTAKSIEEKEESFMKIDKAPTFPGCEEGDKKCFSRMVQKHFVKNFDRNLPKKLGLESGKKRIFIAFKIDKLGNVVDVKARAPHEDIKEEVLSVMNSLPKMTPGENKGEAITVNYSIPFTIIVE